MPAHPFYPIIYLRGYAATQGAIEDTVATPYMGFNLGSTKIRQSWDRSVEKHIFESPLVRLMKDYGYEDSFRDGRMRDDTLPAKSVVIHRYYEPADRDLGTGDRPSIEAAANELSNLVKRVREQVCGDDEAARREFRVYLVAHSMGGLICRCFLQNDQVGDPEAKALVDKVFTYGTPHNGIEARGINVPGWLGIWDADTFNRARIADFLALGEQGGRVDSLEEKFDARRFFCLIGTNHKDYSLAQYAIGPMSDGLVKIANASVQGAPRAFVHRAHSGHYGLVNSEEGYQNLVRFLFGDTFVTGTLELDELPLPPYVQKKYDDGHEIRASYFFEATVTPRGAFDFNLTERRVEDCSAAFRKFDELFHPERVNLAQRRSPVLFSVFLDSKKIVRGRAMKFHVDLQVRTTDFVIERKVLGRREALPAVHIFRERLAIEAIHTNEGWRLTYQHEDEKTKRKLDGEGGGAIELKSKTGFRAKLRLDIAPWNREPR